MLRKASVLLLPLALASVECPALALDDADEVAEFWCPEHDSPPGSRMKCHSGKMWPDVARPNAPSEPFIHRYHTAHYWPNPYRWQDRGSVRAHVEATRGAGWITTTTLYESHFDPDTNELNQAGRVHLKWIMIHTPPNRRTAFVQAGDSPEVSQMRLASVQTAATRLSGNDAPNVMLRVCEQYGVEAQESDLIRRSYLSSFPVPRIPSKSSGQANNLGGKSLDAGEGGP